VTTLRTWPAVILAVLLAACSIDLSEPTSPTAFVPVLQPAGQETATARAGIAAEEAGQNPSWSHMGLQGKIIYSSGTDGVQQLDLATGTITILFTPPDRAWLTAVSVAPVTHELALAYAPPPPGNEVQLGYTSLYRLPGDCADRPQGCTHDDLQPLLLRTGSHEAYFSPVWSPDGRFLYFSHFTPSDSETGSAFKYSLERIALPEGSPETIVENGLWPAVSPDGTRLVYIEFDTQDYSDHMYIADADGANAARLLDPAAFEAVDAPLFSHQGQRIIFSAVGQGPGREAGRPDVNLFLDWLLGVRTASAHNVPSDWWSMPVEGGRPTQLTFLGDVGLIGTLAPDGEHMAFLAASGLYVMRVDGSELTILTRSAGNLSLKWVP
jgi:hypothetical protein